MASSGRGLSLVERIARLPPHLRSRVQADAARVSPAARWRAIRRPEQAWPEGAWSWWLLLAGRGWGKTLTGVSSLVEAHLERGYTRTALVGRTAGDIRRTLVEGKSGVLRVARSMGARVEYNPSRALLAWPGGGSTLLLSAAEPDTFRGPEVQLAVADELATYSSEAWENLELMLRLEGPGGAPPRGIAMTTPRAKRWLAELLASADTVASRGATYDNASNLPAKFLRRIEARFAGSSRAAAELHGILSLDSPGALWKQARIDAHRVEVVPAPGETDLEARRRVVGGLALEDVVVAVDPAVTADEDSDETGIVAVGVRTVGGLRHAYVLEDASLVAEPGEWAARADEVASRWGASRIVAEANQGGELVRSVLRIAAPRRRVDLVWSSAGKATRAEPVATLAAQGRVHHVGTHRDLEAQLCAWEPGDESPDRLDALVHGVHALRLSSVHLAMAHAPERLGVDDEDEGELAGLARDLAALRR